MPYGLKKSIGGDSPANESKMVRCIADLQAKGHSKLSAILICKSSIQRAKKKS